MSLRNFCNRKECTCWFDSLFGKDWSECCGAHDIDVIYQLPKTFLNAQKNLFNCVSERSKLMAVIMSMGSFIPSAIFWFLYKNNYIK